MHFPRGVFSPLPLLSLDQGIIFFCGEGKGRKSLRVISLQHWTQAKLGMKLQHRAGFPLASLSLPSLKFEGKSSIYLV